MQQISSNLELIRYRLFGEEMLLLEQASAPSSSGSSSTNTKNTKPAKARDKSHTGDKTYAECVERMSDPLKELSASLDGYITSLGDDVQRKVLKLYVAYKRLKNFTSVVIHKNRLVHFLNLNPAKLVPLPAIARDVSQYRHWAPVVSK